MLDEVGDDAFGVLFGGTVDGVEHEFGAEGRFVGVADAGKIFDAAGARLDSLPTLRLAGNAYDGAGLPDCVRSGETAADELLVNSES